MKKPFSIQHTYRHMYIFIHNLKYEHIFFNSSTYIKRVTENGSKYNAITRKARNNTLVRSLMRCDYKININIAIARCTPISVQHHRPNDGAYDRSINSKH